MIVSSTATKYADTQSDTNSSSSTDKPMGKTDFLKLLVAQMQAQDPLSPMDSADFSAQLAQFSALEQMQNVNTNLESLIQYQVAAINNTALNLIGKTVIATGDGLTITDGKPDTIIYELGGDASSVTINIFDSENNKVASIERGTKSVDTYNYVWDGKDSNGNTLPDGDYTYTLTAIDSSGRPVASKTYQKSKITGVVYEDGVIYAVAGNSKINVNDITEVSST